jgi:hypothetical protein
VLPLPTAIYLPELGLTETAYQAAELESVDGVHDVPLSEYAPTVPVAETATNLPVLGLTVTEFHLEEVIVEDDQFVPSSEYAMAVDGPVATTTNRPVLGLTVIVVQPAELGMDPVANHVVPLSE